MNRSVLARQMFANGGQAVPNEYKGFSRLPEAVQMRMDPTAAKKYENGGEIYSDRPTDFRGKISEELRRDIDRVKAGLISEKMDQQRQMENIDALQALRGRAQAQAMGANQYGVPLTGLDDVSRTDASQQVDFDPNNIYNISRFFRSNPGAKVSDYNRYFRTNLNPEEFEIFETEAEPVGMAMGGDPAMAQGVGSMMPPPPAMPPAQGPMGDAQAMDPQVIQGLLSEASQSIGDLDNAEDYATVINSIRGEEASIEERYEELAGIVGEEDAAQTPESVLALTQPAIMMGAVDQGIGGLAQEEMTEPVQGAMAQGIMSTVAPPPPAAPPMDPAMMGGPPPVNFNQGGLVRRGDNQPVQMYENGGETLADFQKMLGVNVTSPQNLSAASMGAGTIPAYEPSYDERVLDAAKGAEARYVKAGLGSAESRAAELEEQKNLTQAQMLFDIAQTALTYAGPMQGERPGMSAAERLAMAASSTKLPQTIGARAQTLAEQKKAAGKEERALKLAAVQRGETQVDKEIAAENALALVRAKPKKASFINVLDKTGTKSLGSYDISTTAGAKAVEKLVSENEGAFPTTNMPREPKDKDVVLYDNKTGAQSPIFNKNSEEGQAAMAAWKKANPLKDGAYFELKPPTAPTPKGPITEKDFFDKFGFTFASFGELSPDMQNYVRGLPVITDKDYFAKYGVTKSEFSELDQNTQKFMMGLPVLTDKDYMSKYGMPKADFLALPTETKNRLARVAPDRKTVVVDGQVIDITEGKTPVAIYGDKDVKTITLDGEVLNITDPENVTVMYGDKNRDIRIVKGQLVEVPEDGGAPVAVFGERTPKTGTFENMILSNGKNILIKKVGETLYDKTGQVIDLSAPLYEDAVLVSKDKAFSEARLAGSQAAAGDKLKRLNQEMGDDAVARQISGSESILGMTGGSNASRRTFDALKAARNGVGLYNKLGQVFSEVGGAIIPALQDVAADKVEAGNYIDSVNLLFRVALANSPRFAEAEQQRLASLAPSTENFLANPENAVRKLIGLKRLMQAEYQNNLSALSRSSTPAIRQQAEQQNFAIEGVLKMLETIPDRGFVADEDFMSAMDEVERRMKARKAAQ